MKYFIKNLGKFILLFGGFSVILKMLMLDKNTDKVFYSLMYLSATKGRDKKEEEAIAQEIPYTGSQIFGRPAACYEESAIS